MKTKGKIGEAGVGCFIINSFVIGVVLIFYLLYQLYLGYFNLDLDINIKILFGEIIRFLVVEFLIFVGIFTLVNEEK